jgi:hypothetical protein
MQKLAGLQARRVKVTDSRMLVSMYAPFSCFQCHKRIGNSVIAVHVPQYVASSAFLKKLVVILLN